MNHLEPAAENRWNLPRHAYLVVYERDGRDGDERGLLTIYDCGAAQKPPSATLLGTLESVDARAAIDRTPTGRIVKLGEPSVLERRPGDRYRIARR